MEIIANMNILAATFRDWGLHKFLGSESENATCHWTLRSRNSTRAQGLGFRFSGSSGAFNL